MRRQKHFLLFFLLVAEVISIFCLTSFCAAQPSNPDDFLILVDFKVENQPLSARIIIRTSRYFEYTDYELSTEPFRIAFDPTEHIYVNFEKSQLPNTGLINNIKFVKSSFKQSDLPSILLKEGFYPVDYFVINLDRKTDYKISQRANMLVIDIGQAAPVLPQELISSFTIKNPQIKAQPGDVESDFIKYAEKFKTLKTEETPKEEIFTEETPEQALNNEDSEQTLDNEDLEQALDNEDSEQTLDNEDSEQALDNEGSGQAMDNEDSEQTLDNEDSEQALDNEGSEQAMNFQQLRDDIMSRSLFLKGPIVKLPEGKSVLNFNECLEIATANFIPLVIAEEEMRLNDMKINEAKRGLYPTATAKYAFTDGKAAGVEFTEKTYGMQVEQPLYYGGRLKLTLKQAQVNRQVAQAKFDKAEADITAKITETFYNLATAQLNLNDQKELLTKSREILALAGNKYYQELITKLEFLNVGSQANQIEYQLAVAEKDLDIARINLLQAMDVDPDGQITVDMELDGRENIIDLNSCLYLAYQNRPELHISELLQEAAGYEEKIAKAKDDFQVGFTGFLGQSGSAYKSENLTMGSDWFVGVKASKPLLGNVGSYNFTQNKTSPKLGQSTVTQGSSQSLELGILSNLTGYSEKQSALISKLKTENELIETEKSINTEVREAYNNYEKAVMQMQNTREKIGFREEELKVLQSQSEINEAMLSQVLDAMVKLNDEKALYHQAIASYKSALANLNKAIGLIGYFN